MKARLAFDQSPACFPDDYLPYIKMRLADDAKVFSGLKQQFRGLKTLQPIMTVVSTGHNVKRVLGLDVGARRIGVAVSDPLGITAQGLETIWRKNKRADWEQLGRVLAQYGVGEIVVGNPLHMSGDSGSQSGKMMQFAEELGHRFGLPVHLRDERLTTSQAQRVLRETSMSGSKRGKVVDQMAAVLILQSFLESRSSSASNSDEG